MVFKSPGSRLSTLLHRTRCRTQRMRSTLDAFIDDVSRISHRKVTGRDVAWCAFAWESQRISRRGFWFCFTHVVGRKHAYRSWCRYY